MLAHRWELADVGLRHWVGKMSPPVYDVSCTRSDYGGKMCDNNTVVPDKEVAGADAVDLWSLAKSAKDRLDRSYNISLYVAVDRCAIAHI